VKDSSGRGALRHERFGRRRNKNPGYLAAVPVAVAEVVLVRLFWQSPPGTVALLLILPPILVGWFTYALLARRHREWAPVSDDRLSLDSGLEPGRARSGETQMNVRVLHADDREQDKPASP
jgi:hypothetical protein